MNERAIDDCLALLRQAEHVVVFTGAGVSAESGIPTFRDALTGLWLRQKPSELTRLWSGDGTNGGGSSCRAKNPTPHTTP